jgi:endoglucanase
MSIFPRPTKLLLPLSLGLMLLATGTSQAAMARSASGSAGSVSLDQSAYSAHENQGYLNITIQRTGDISGAEHVGYGVKRQDAQPGIDFGSIANTYIKMAPGQASYTFQVPIIDQGINATPVSALAYLYSSWPADLGANTNSIVTILHDDPLQRRDAGNPLGVKTPVAGNLLAGAKLYVDPSTPAALASQRLGRSNPAWARLLGVIGDQPAAHRFYMWNMGSTVEGQVAHYLESTQRQQPGTTVMLSTYGLVHDHCGYTATPAMAAGYDTFIRQLAAGIGNFHVVLFLELDSLITAPCLNRAQLAIREAELRHAVSVLEADPHILVYLDGGAADASPPGPQARLLRDSGVGHAQGFFLNSTHFDWMTTELHYGQQISRRLGGAHFIINSGENGRGPLVPASRVRSGNEVLCNPAGRGLGPLTVSRGVAQPTGFTGADGFLWFSNPGGSGGQCVPGAPPTGVFWPAYAAMLANNRVDAVTGPRMPLLGPGALLASRHPGPSTHRATKPKPSSQRSRHHRHTTARRHRHAPVRHPGRG